MIYMEALFLFATNNAILTQRRLRPDRATGIWGILVSQVEARLMQWTIRKERREVAGAA